MPTDCFVKLTPMSVTETIIEVIAAGPANNGIANGNILILSERLLRPFSFLWFRLSKSISSEIINRIIPPAIVNAENDILRELNIKFPKKAKNNNMMVAIVVASNAVLILSLIFKRWVTIKNKGVVPKGSIAIKYKTNVWMNISNIKI